MTPRARWSLAIGGLGLVTAIAACLNPQPLPPADARATDNGEDGGATFGGSDASLGVNTDGATTDVPTADAGDAGADAGDAGDAATG